jgi:Nitrile hydratase beta subunit, C-terminal
MFTAGDRVRASHVDPPHHTRVPSYVRGAVGTVLDVQGSWPLPDDTSRGLRTSPRTVYTVQFAARELFGAGDHTVIMSMWQDYLEAA